MDCNGACKCVCVCAGGVKMASPSYPVSSMGSLFSHISNCAPILCLQLPSTSYFYTVLDQAIRLPGGTSLLSFISDAAVFPNPSLLRDCRPHPGMFTGPCCCQCPETAIGCQLHPFLPAGHRFLKCSHNQNIFSQKMFSQSCSSSVSGIMENCNTHLATLSNLSQHQ